MFGSKCEWGEGPLRLGIEKGLAAAALGSALAAALGGCMSTGSAPEPPPVSSSRPSITPDMLVGKWGLASYRKDADKARTAAQAREQCGKPYVIGKGPSGGVMMYQPDQSQAQELVVKAADGKTFIGPAERARREASSTGRWFRSTAA